MDVNDDGLEWIVSSVMGMCEGAVGGCEGEWVVGEGGGVDVG